jgi:hypothetical protein
MTVAEILDQARALSPQECKELAKLLIDTLDTRETNSSEENSKIVDSQKTK